ncbi:hypothetical protein [Plastoroseomonas arctica]|uniref:Uncharacterized protein n=1 Tax=Plastoroseomonas arctica TaxID=1509237 RepID=A0AAF1KUN6_9PROT|nr:hypothetical protein [Plastoroseomonas arctica]MBR0656622.1 hypothetical protein [Plastoroseomonas arctica]
MRQRSLSLAALLCLTGALLAFASDDRLEPGARDQPSAEAAAHRAGTLDRYARALIERASDEPVTLGIRAVRRWVGSGTSIAADERIVFRLRAAAISLIDLNDLRATNQRIGWTFWSRSLDPVRSDTEVDRAACAPTNGACLAQGRVFARRQGCEYELRVELTGVIGTAENRQRVLWAQSGMREGGHTRLYGPCAHRHDAALDMLSTDEPLDSRAAQACQLSGFVGVVGPDGRRHRPANFLKLEPDGTPRFVVRCQAYVRDAPDGRGRTCELQGYFGIWPLFMWVPSNRAAEWNETFLRVRDHLARHVVSRSDR